MLGITERLRPDAAATVAAMGPAGSDLALETADAVVVRDEPAAVPVSVALSRRAGRLITQNLVIAGVFITGLVIWDLTGRDGRRGPRGALPEGTPPRERDASLRESTDPECAFSGSSMNVILAEINR
ncbi:hypothetical protein [Nonomuraea sp. SBT364]|uniref:hypothetical protein n=1 Tax=Nonomuraea sp. SBT364 TaxID=1580530 RepID=UPI0018CF73A7